MKLTTSNLIISSGFLYYTLAKPNKIHPVPSDVINPERVKYYKYLGDPAATGGSQRSSYNCNSKLKCNWEVDETWKESEWDWDRYAWIDHFIAQCKTVYQCQNYKTDCSEEKTKCQLTGESQILKKVNQVPEKSNPSNLNSSERPAKLAQNNFESLNPNEDEFGGDDEFIGGDDGALVPSTHSANDDSYTEYISFTENAGQQNQSQEDSEPVEEQQQNEPKTKIPTEYSADDAALKRFYQENYSRINWNQAYRWS